MINFSHIFTVYRREMAAYFNNAIAYMFITVFVLLNGGLFMTNFFLIGRADMRNFFTTLPFILAVFLPAITMRQWAEERKGNTLELLLTFPMGTHELVIGKFLAGLFFYLAALAGTLPIPIMLHLLGRPDMGVLIGGYAGAALLGCLYLSIGIFISGLCKDQIVAFILSMITCFGLHLLGTEFLAASIDGWFSGIGTLLQQFVGSTLHYGVFAKGVLSITDTIYFLIGTLLFLILNGFWLEGRMRPKSKGIFTSAVVICAGIFITTNWVLAGVPIGRFDLTESQLHSISPATSQILRNLQAPVIARFYVSPQAKMPTGMKTLEQEVIDKLEEFKISSGGNFDYQLFHMEAANVVEKAAGEEESLEEQLQKKGVQPFQVRAVESDEVAVRLIYSAISLSYIDKAEEIIPRIMPANMHELEYNVISKLYRMTLPATPKIAMVAPYEEKEVDPQIKALLAQLGGGMPEGYREDHYETLEMSLNYEGYEIERIRLTEDEPISDDITTLVIAEPKELNDRQRYEINRFLHSGGSVFMSVQNYEYTYAPEGQTIKLHTKDKKPMVNDLLREWGVEVEEAILVDEQSDVINLSGGARMGPFAVSVPVKIPVQILLNQPNMNQDISITSRLNPMFYLWGTAVKLNEDKLQAQGLKAQTLISSSDNSWTVPFRGGAITPSHLEPKDESRIGPFPVAVLIEGQFVNTFADKDIPAWPKDEELEDAVDAALDAEGESASDASDEPDEEKADIEISEDVMSIASAPGKLIVIGASSLFQKHLVTGGGNLDFFMNSVDVLSLGDELVTIRSKQPISRTIKRASTAQKAFWRFVVTFLVPAIIFLIGFVRLVLRKKTKTTYMKNLVASK